ncbi:DNA polymerase theta [Lachnellula suecica]|uniref:DNA polymerase theta n=1 Tax=Lachnellula suecica TaxID=602035 RepID=A0A8T9CL33_9HELO|nr:DNA polymerase theta [Lachnellula suecica]
MDVNTTPRIYHKTSVETARANYSTLSHIGQKRTFDVFHGGQDTASKAIPSDVTNRDFHRPLLQAKCFEGLKASEIQDFGDRSQSEYSQRRGLALTPNSTSNPLLDLSHPSYRLPAQLVRNFANNGVKSIYPWQSECLLQSGALGGEQNLVYTAPTGGGKSLVADILMLKKVLENPGQKALLVLPYVALVQEKLRWLRKIVDGISKTAWNSSCADRPQTWRKRGDEDTVRVVGLFGGNKSKANWAETDIVVCTIEKANSLVNTAIEDGSVGLLGAVVIDELHMLNDEHRGYILELMATKLLSLEQNVQIIAMSATLNNADLLAKWLGGAKFYISRYRPVPVEEHLVFDNAVYAASTSSRFYKTATQLNSGTQLSSQAPPVPSRIIQPSQFKEFSNHLINAVVSLANETARAGYGALAVKEMQLSSAKSYPAGQVDMVIMDRRLELLHDLRSTSTGLDTTLEKTVPVGVAFHRKIVSCVVKAHFTDLDSTDAGLTAEERDLIATAYDLGVIKVIVATCSLAAGINLPARRVILHGARMGADFVGPSML